MRAIRRVNPVRRDGTPRNSTLAGVLGLAFVVGLIAPVYAGAAELVYSRLADRSNAVALDGTTLDGLIHVAVSGAPKRAAVDFYVDDPDQSGFPARTDRRKPFDLVGGSRRSAKALDLGELPPGLHTVTAVIRTKRRTETVLASFNIGLIAPAYAGAAELVYSRFADRSNAVALDGTTLDGLIHVAVSGAPKRAAVDFYVDDPDQSGSPARTDRRKPFDLVGGSRRSAEALDLGELPPGLHTVTAVIRTKRRTETVLASFNIAAPEPENLPPSILSVPAQSTAEGETLSFTVSANDPDNGPPSLQAIDLPPGATFSPGVGGTGEFRWTPGFLAAGGYSATFEATDTADSTLVDSLSVSIAVADTNRPPSLSPVAPQSVEAGQVLSVSVSGTDPDGTNPALAASSLPPGALLSDFGNGTGRLEWSPGDSNVGDHTVRLTAIDASDPNLVDASNLTITVTAAPNLPPSIQSISSKTTAEGQTLAFTVNADDPDNGPPLLSASNIPPGATFTPLGGGSAEFSWAPGYDSDGAYTVTFTATDAKDPTLIASIDVGISITDTNRPPSLAPVGPQSVEAGQFLSVSVAGSDPDGTSPVLAGSSLPPGALLSDYGNGTGRLEWSPGDSNVGDHIVRLTAIDAGDPNLVDATDLIITVTAAPNLPPNIQSISSKTVGEGQTLAFTVNADDPDSGPPTLSASNIPAGATFTPLGGGSAEFSWAPGYDSDGAYTVTFTATDAEDPTLIASIDVGISITDTNRPPSLAPVGPQSVEAGQSLSVSVSGSDPDGTNPVLAASSLPPGALLSDYGNGTGRLEWSPGDSNVGDHIVRLTAIDASDPNLVDASDLTITVTAAPNLPPSIQSISSKTTAEGQTLAFTVNADDPDNGPPLLSASNIPTGATFTPLGGGSAEFSWTPGYDSAGAYTVTFTGTDAADPTLIASINVGISITDTNRPPSFAPINAQSVEAGQTLTVNVSATDPDGTPPVLSIQPLPTGAMFTDNGNGTGALVWGAADTDVGSHSLGIVAQDAVDSALSDSQQMLISVTEALPQPLAPVTVVWDSHPQSILGYKVFYGPSEEAAIFQISELRIDAGDINAADPSVTYDPEVDLGLQAGDPACFRVSAFDETIESPLSQAACM